MSRKPEKSEVTVELELQGLKRNCSKTRRIVKELIAEALHDATWEFFGKGTVGVKWVVKSKLKDL